MNDYEYAFKEDAREKKAAGRGAFARKGGSKSKRCSLPSDNLTPAQMRALNGEVNTLNLNAPMTWVKFKAMPKDLQEEYIRKIIATFGVTVATISQYLFGCSEATLGSHAKRLGLKLPYRKGVKVSDVCMQQFQEWIDGRSVIWASIADRSPEPEIPAESICVGEIAIPKTEARFPVKSLEMHMEGSASDLIQALTMFLCGRDAELEISIKFKEES